MFEHVALTYLFTISLAQLFLGFYNTQVWRQNLQI